MACKKQTVPFKGTPEQEAALKSAIAELGYAEGPGNLWLSSYRSADHDI